MTNRWIVREGKVRGEGRYLIYFENDNTATGPRWVERARAWPYESRRCAERDAAGIGRVVRLRPVPVVAKGAPRDDARAWPDAKALTGIRMCLDLASDVPNSDVVAEVAVVKSRQLLLEKAAPPSDALSRAAAEWRAVAVEDRARIIQATGRGLRDADMAARALLEAAAPSDDYAARLAAVEAMKRTTPYAPGGSKHRAMREVSEQARPQLEPDVRARNEDVHGGPRARA